jgi:hypothetical protein
MDSTGKWESFRFRSNNIIIALDSRVSTKDMPFACLLFNPQLSDKGIGARAEGLVQGLPASQKRIPPGEVKWEFWTQGPKS